MPNKIKYPRRILIRQSLRFLGRGLMPLLARTQIRGRERFPRKGPVILVGNHTAAMEVVMMAVYPPQIVEYMGSVDIPHDGFMAAFVGLYGVIPVFRGNVSTSSMKMGVDVLKQGGTLGVFPEGGIWEPSIRRAQSGVAWLSYHAQAPILPIGFGSMAGALKKIFALERPVLKMNVGELMPPVRKPEGKSHKQHFQDEADRVMDAVWGLIPAEDRTQEARVQDERFELLVDVHTPGGGKVPIPDALQIKNGAAFSKFTHRVTLIKNFIFNLKLFEVETLMHLVDSPSLDDILKATTAILEHLESENPYYFTYRYGQKEGRAMETGIREVDALVRWAKSENLDVKFTPLRRFTAPSTGEEVLFERTQEIEKW
jgi:1-acyl-sn-glycerol-3-phosphate acyltransferase